MSGGPRDAIDATAPAPTQWPRISTGNPQADAILGGGYPSNSINIVMGQPGTGKTIFAEQMLFHNARGDRPLLYVTTLAEPLSKVVSYVQRFRFYDEAALGTSVLYEDLGVPLSKGGPQALVVYLREAIKTLSPRIIVIDSFKAIHDLAESPLEMRRLVTDLAGLLSAYDVTTFLLGEYDQENARVSPEFAVADSIVEFARNGLTARDERFLRVRKLRGSTYREGQHGFRITDAGLQIFPRLVTPRISENYKPLLERVSSGVPGLDAVIGGGLWRGSTTLVMGATGAGKTTVALQFAIDGVRRGEPTLFVNFQENPAQLRRTRAGLDPRPDQATQADLHHLYASPVELQIDSIIVTIFDQLDALGIRRVVIDALGDLSGAASDPQRFHDYLYSLMQHFVVRNITSILTFESVAGVTASQLLAQRFSYMSDNVLFLETGGTGRTARGLRVVKTRNSGHDPHTREVTIDAGGLRVL